jgi:apolipoprotein D and lipocalin family protein
MKLVLVFIISLFLFTVNGHAQNKQLTMETVKSVDLKRYAGVWYEIAKIPNSFQKSCSCCTTAEYIIQPDGDLKVINRCIKEDGSAKIAEGIAKAVKGSGNAKLEVSFFSILGIRPFWGDYWIIGLDKDYAFAVIGSPDRKYGWILSRTPKLDDEKFAAVSEILKKNGYKQGSFVFTKQ